MVVDEFPMTVTGKVRKVEMREKSVEDARSGRRRVRAERLITAVDIDGARDG